MYLDNLTLFLINKYKLLILISYIPIKQSYIIWHRLPMRTSRFFDPTTRLDNIVHTLVLHGWLNEW